jgi:hypothetical protein
MTEALVEELRVRFNINENFYPNMLMDVDLPNGFKSEVDSVKEILGKNGFDVGAENVAEIMFLKKTLLQTYASKDILKSNAAKYKDLLQAKEPIGCTAPLEYILVSGLVAIAVFVVTKFVGSFCSEAGKIEAKKLLSSKDAKREIVNREAITSVEYNFYVEQLNMICEQDNEPLERARKRLKRRKVVK